TVRIWEVETGAEVRRWRASDGWVYCLAISPDGRQIASALDDQIALWDWRGTVQSEPSLQASSWKLEPQFEFPSGGTLLSPEIARDPARLADVLARLAFQDRSRLRLCEAPDTAAVREALRA